MESRAFVRLAAIVVAVGWTSLAVFQVALIAGAPLGRAAWGGRSTYLPNSLRIASAATILIYVLGALLVLRRAGFPSQVDLTGVCALGNVGFCDHSDPRGFGQLPFTAPLGTFLIGASALLLAARSLILAIKGTDTVNTSSAELEDPGPGATSRS